MVKLEQIHYDDWMLFSHTTATTAAAADAAQLLYQKNIVSRLRKFKMRSINYGKLIKVDNFRIKFVLEIKISRHMQIRFFVMNFQVLI